VVAEQLDELDFDAADGRRAARIVAVAATGALRLSVA
jgi:hypothetical protein